MTAVDVVLIVALFALWLGLFVLRPRPRQLEQRWDCPDFVEDD